MIYKTITAAFIIVFSAGTLAGDVAKDKMSHGEKVQQDFLTLDKDGNGLLTKDEVGANPKIAGSFVDIDLNDNNDIDLDEYLIYRSEATAAGRPEKNIEQKAVE